MREIKFRAWDVSEGTMVDWYHLLNDPDYWLLEILSGESEDKLMQFTGLHDKNGKEIYEGDIVKDNYYPDNSDHGEEVFIKISFDSDLLCYKGNIFSDRDGIECEDVFYIKSDSKRLVVVGNIYQNPELLNTI